MPRPPLSLRSLSSGGRASGSGSHHETGATSSPGISSRNGDGRESSSDPDSDGEGNLQESEGGDVPIDGRNTVGLNVEPTDRVKLTIIGKEFEPDYAMNKAREIVHCHYKEPWIYFSEVPTLDRRIWFLEFKKKFCWEESIQEAVSAIWKMKSSEHLSSTFYKARTKGKKPSWIYDRHWATMMKRWAEDEKFQQHSEINKKNRASENPNGSAAFTGGSKSVIGHIKTFLKINNKEPTIVELMKMTYKKKNGEWSGTRPTKALARFKELVAKAEEEGENVDAVKFWVKAVGVKRGRVFGLGSRVHDVPPELLEKYSFAKLHKADLQCDDECHKFREDIENKVSTLKIEIGAIKEQMTIVKTLVQNMASYLQQPFPSFHGHPSQVHFQGMQSQFRYNPTSVQGSPMAIGDAPTSFTSLLNSNSMLTSLDASNPLGPSMVGNIASDLS